MNMNIKNTLPHKTIHQEMFENTGHNYKNT